MNCPGKCNNFRGSVYYHVTKLPNPWTGGKTLLKRTREGKRSGPHVYLTATKIWYRLKRFSGTKCHNIHVLYHLKRFLGTVCYEHGEWPRPAWRFFGDTPSDAERVVC